MKHLALVIMFFSACTPSDGSKAERGEKGDTGAAGAPGLNGAQGPSGVCDSNSCPSVTSIGGLAGGHVGGTTTADQIVITQGITYDTGSATGPKGIVLARGGRSTSADGFFCAATMFNVNGVFVSQTPGNDYGGLSGTFRVAKRHCENACGSPVAHACRASEVRTWQELGGGSATSGNQDFRNADVPMPPNGDYWIASADIISDCKVSNSGEGLSFSLSADEGTVVKVACASTMKLLCCQ